MGPRQKALQSWSVSLTGDEGGWPARWWNACLAWAGTQNSRERERVAYFHFCTQRKLREVSTKFQLFQKPANFEQRMLDCKRVLDGVKAELHVLSVKDVDPDVIQTHLDKCMVSLRRRGRLARPEMPL